MEVGKLVFGVALFGVAAIVLTLARRWWEASGAAALALLVAAGLLYRRSRDRADAASGPNLLLCRKARLAAAGLQGITPYLEAGEAASRVVFAGARLRRFMLVATCRRIMLLRLGRVSTRIRGLEVSTSLHDAHWKIVVPDGSRTATLNLQVDGTRRVVYVGDRWWVELDAMAADIRAQGAPK